MLRSPSLSLRWLNLEAKASSQIIQESLLLQQSPPDIIHIPPQEQQLARAARLLVLEAVEAALLVPAILLGGDKTSLQDIELAAETALLVLPLTLERRQLTADLLEPALEPGKSVRLESYGFTLPRALAVEKLSLLLCFAATSLQIRAGGQAPLELGGALLELALASLQLRGRLRIQGLQLFDAPREGFP